MKIIDLLNKIANGEEPPKKILFDNKVYKWNDGVDYENEDEGWTEFLLSQKCICKDFLNDEVEILETTITYNQEEKITLEDFKNLGYSLSKIKDKFQEGWEEAEKEDKIKKLSYQQIGSWALEKHNWADYARAVDKQIQQIGSKINEIIDRVNAND